MKKFICLLLGLTMSFSVFACGGKGKPSNDPNTVDVMVNLVGYGTDWIQEVADNFNNAYKEEGYKVNILPPMSHFEGNKALTEMRNGFENTGYDIVLTGGVSIAEITNPDYGVCAEDVSDVMSAPAINYDKSTSSTTIAQSFKNIHPWELMDGDKYLAFPYVASIGGLVCNTKLLAKYGITNLPRTTDELFEDYDIILNGANGARGMRPTTWGGNNAYGYALSPLYVGLSQLMGYEGFQNFYDMKYLVDENGKIAKDGYNMVNNSAIPTMMEVIMHGFDPLYSVQGAATQKHEKANAQLVTSKAAFMYNGEYYYNEVRVNFGNYIKDIDFTAVPMVSELGVKLNLATDRKAADKILRDVLSLVDEGKTGADIISAMQAKGVNLTAKQVDAIIDARKINHVDISQAYILKGSTAVTPAKLFLRMLASKDAANTYNKSGMLSPFVQADMTADTPKFIKNANKIFNNTTHYTTTQMRPGSVRKQLGNLFIFAPYNATLPTKYAEENGAVGNVEDRDYGVLAQNSFNKVKNHMEKNWNTIVKVGGYELAE